MEYPQEAEPLHFAKTARAHLGDATDRPVGMMEQIDSRLALLECLVDSLGARLDGTVARIFCEPSAVQTGANKPGSAPAELANLPSISTRVERILERAHMIDAQTRRLAEQL